MATVCICLGPTWLQVGLVEVSHLLSSGCSSPGYGPVARVLVPSVLGKVHLLVLLSRRGQVCCCPGKYEFYSHF